MNLTKKIIGCAMTVHRRLGVGFLECIYERALAIELEKRGLNFERQVPFRVFYRNQLIGRFIADMVIENKVIVELKATTSLAPGCEAQLLNYLKASPLKVGLLFNFGSRLLKTRRLVDELDEAHII